MGSFDHELLHGYGYGEVADRIKAAWQAGDRAGAAAAMPRHILDDLVVAGTRADCLAGIELRRRAGFEHIVVFPPHSVSPEQFTATLHAVAPAAI